jgi:hypothetical protein
VQVRAPNRALRRETEGANEVTERVLKEVEDELVEVRFSIRNL